MPRGQQWLSRTSLEHQANKQTSAWSAWTTFSVQHALNLHTKFHEACAGLDEVSRLLMGFPAFSSYHRQISAVFCDHSLAPRPGGVTWCCTVSIEWIIWSCGVLADVCAPFLLNQCWTMFFILEACVKSEQYFCSLPFKVLVRPVRSKAGAQWGLLGLIQAWFCRAVFGYKLWNHSTTEQRVVPVCPGPFSWVIFLWLLKESPAKVSAKAGLV